MPGQNLRPIAVSKSPTAGYECGLKSEVVCARKVALRRGCQRPSLFHAAVTLTVTHVIPVLSSREPASPLAPAMPPIPPCGAGRPCQAPWLPTVPIDIP